MMNRYRVEDWMPNPLQQSINDYVEKIVRA